MSDFESGNMGMITLKTVLGVLMWTLLVACAAAPPTDDADRKAKVEQMYAAVKADIKGVEDIAAKEVMEKLKTGEIVLLDVRSAKEMDVSRIPGAITAKEFLDDRGKYKDKTVVAYCTIGYRSGKFAQQMQRQGIVVKNLQAGLLGWTYAGGALIAPSGRQTNKLHLFGPDWNLAPKGYVGVW